MLPISTYNLLFHEKAESMNCGNYKDKQWWDPDSHNFPDPIISYKNPQWYENLMGMEVPSLGGLCKFDGNELVKRQMSLPCG